MAHSGVKSRNTFTKYRLLLHGTVKRPGVGTNRQVVTWELAEQIRQLNENPLLLEELTRSNKRDCIRDAMIHLLHALAPDEQYDPAEDPRQEEAVLRLGSLLESDAAAEGIALAITLLLAQNPMLSLPPLLDQQEEDDNL
jgi:hypothetical protein